MKIKISQFIERERPILFLVILFAVAVVFSLSKNYYLKVKGATTKNYPVVVWDDNERIIANSDNFDSQTVLTKAGITVYPEDKIQTDLITDPVTDGGAGQKITIQRAPVYTVSVDGSNLTVRSWGKTVKDVLKDKVDLGLKDIVSPTLEAAAVPGTIEITRINVVETEQLVPVPFSNCYQDDYYTPKGTSQTVTAGVNGQNKQYLTITYRNGLEVSRVVTGEELVTLAVTQVTKRGLMPSGSPDFNRTYWNMMVDAGLKYGVSPADLFNVASCESHVNPASSGAYYGMFQYNLGFWDQASSAAGYGGALWSDAKAQIYTTAYWVSNYGWGRWGCRP